MAEAISSEAWAIYVVKIDVVKDLVSARLQSVSLAFFSLFPKAFRSKAVKQTVKSIVKGKSVFAFSLLQNHVCKCLCYLLIFV